MERAAGVEPASPVWKTGIITAIRYPHVLLAIKIMIFFVAGPRKFFTVWLHTPQNFLPRASNIIILIRSHRQEPLHTSLFSEKNQLW